MEIDQFRNTSFAIALVMKLFMVFVIIRNIEFLLLYREFKKNGVFSWHVMRLRNQNRVARLFSFLDLLCTFRAFFTTLVISSCCAILFIVYYEWDYLWILFLPVFVSNLLIQYRLKIACDGSDSLANVFSVCLLIAVCNIHSEGILRLTLIFIAVQIILSFFFSGLSKMKAEAWASGDALYNISRTNLFGSKTFEKVVVRMGKRNSKKLNVLIGIWQVVFPFSILLPFPFFLGFLLSAMVFHILIAWFMGLNRFMWLYLAAYPSLVYLKCIFPWTSFTK